MREYLARVWTRSTFEDRITYSVLLGFWVAIVAMIVAISTGRWP